MTKVARIRRFGGPEAIEWIDEKLPPPGRGEVRVRHLAVGVNFIDTYHRSGLYPIDLPGTLGVELVGIIEDIGPDVAGFAVGDRVGHFGPERGAYAGASIRRADTLLKVPDDIEDEAAAALLLKGCTTEMLVERCARVEKGMQVLVHAAAGGVGQVLVPWLKAIGAHVIGTVGRREKMEAARKVGADHVLLYEEGTDRVRELTNGEGARVVFDGVGKATWGMSLACAARRGLVVSYGNASGAVTGVSLGELTKNGSLFVTRPMAYDYYRTGEERAAGVARLWEMVRSGKVAAHIGQHFPLTDAVQAHARLEARDTVGATILVP